MPGFGERDKRLRRDSDGRVLISAPALAPQAGMLAKALCKRKIKAGQEWVEQDLSMAVANDGRDALSKAV